MQRLYFSLVYFVQAALSFTGIAQTLYLRETVGLSVAQITMLGGIIMLPWTVKPIYGFFSDLLPIRGLRRKPYAIIGSLLAMGGWWWLALGPATYTAVVIGFIIQALGLAITDVICDGLVVDTSTRETAGKLQSLCWSSNAVGSLLGTLLSGVIIATFAHREIFALAAFLPMLTLLFAFRLREPCELASIPECPTSLSRNAREVFRTYFSALKSRQIWIAIAFVYLWNITPSFGTPFYFYMKNDLTFTDSFIGIMGAAGIFGSLLGSLFYAWKIDRYPLRPVLGWTIFIGGVLGFLVFFIRTPALALGISFVQGFAFFLGYMPIMKLASRSCPAHIEASLFALFASAMNLGKMHSQFLGGLLIEPLGLWPLVWVAIGTSFLALFLVPWVRDPDALQI